MMKQPKEVKSWVKYLTGAVTGLVIALVVCLTKDLFKQTDTGMIFRILCDAFFIPGIILAGIGVMTYLSSQGLYDGLTYSFASMARYRKSHSESDKTPKSYFDYKNNKKRRGASWHLVFVGVGFVVIGLVFYLIYNNI